MEELFPCPFCGNKDIECIEEFEYTGLHEGGYAWFVRCNYLKNGCGGRCGSRLNKEEAIKAWNKRQSEAQP